MNSGEPLAPSLATEGLQVAQSFTGGCLALACGRIQQQTGLVANFLNNASGEIKVRKQKRRCRILFGDGSPQPPYGLSAVAGRAVSAVEIALCHGQFVRAVSYRSRDSSIFRNGGAVRGQQ